MGLVERMRRIERKRIALLDEVAALAPEQASEKPRPGAWSILEIVEHLMLVEQAVIGDVARLDALPERPQRLEHHARYLVVMFVLRFPAPVRVPDAAMAPTGRRSLDELRTTWGEQHRLLQRFVAGLDRAGAARAIFRHPIAGPLTVSQGLRMLEVHLDRHGGQIRKLAPAPGRHHARRTLRALALVGVAVAPAGPSLAQDAVRRGDITVGMDIGWTGFHSASINPNGSRLSVFGGYFLTRDLELVADITCLGGDERAPTGSPTFTMCTGSLGGARSIPVHPNVIPYGRVSVGQAQLDRGARAGVGT